MRLGIKMMVTLGLMWAHPPVKGRLRHSENTIKEQELSQSLSIKEKEMSQYLSSGSMVKVSKMLDKLITLSNYNNELRPEGKKMDHDKDHDHHTIATERNFGLVEMS